MNWRDLANPAFLITLGVLAAAAVAMDAGIRAYGIYLRKLPIHPPAGRTLASIPAETAGWVRVGADDSVSAEALDELGTPNYLSRNYTPREAPPEGAAVVQFHAAYYTGMIDTVPHVPERCFQGGGLALSGGPWAVEVPLRTEGWRRHPDGDPHDGDRVLSVALPLRHSSAPNTRVRLPRDLGPGKPLTMRVTEYTRTDGRKLYSGYFFIANGGWVTSAAEVRLLAFNLTDDYAYYLKVQFTAAAGSPEELARMAGSLLDDLLGEIMRCVPDWTDVQAGRYPADNPRRVRPEADPSRS